RWSAFPSGRGLARMSEKKLWRLSANNAGNYIMQKFNIVIASSAKEKERLHSQCFFEIALVLKYGLEELGYEVWSTDGLRRDCTNIILGYHLLDGKVLPKGYDCIIYQLEELHAQGSLPFRILDTLSSPDVIVWDFSQQNIEFLANLGINAIHKPIGFHPQMYRINHSPEKNVDVLFYGSKNERRLRLLRALDKTCNLKMLFGAYGAVRDQWIARSKIVVSIYYYETKFYDDVRMSYLLNNKVFTIVEDTPHRQHEDFVIYTDYDNIVDTCQYYIEKPALRTEITEKAFQRFAEYPESEFLKMALSKSRPIAVPV
ncbi:MAG: hypothetical protein ACE5G1_16150, partial [bacterium]